MTPQQLADAFKQLEWHEVAVKYGDVTELTIRATGPRMVVNAISNHIVSGGDA